jgi:cell division protein FtsW
LSAVGGTQSQTGGPLGPASTRDPGGQAGSDGHSEERGRSQARVETADRPGRGWAYHALWVTSLALLVFGLFMVYSASTASGFWEGGSSLGYLKNQGVAAAVGLVLLLALSRIDYRRWRKLALLALAGALVLLAAIHLPGVGEEVKGAVRSMRLGPVSVQPSEVAKLAMVLVSAHLLSATRAAGKGFRSLALPLVPVTLLVCVLIVTEPDLGTASVVAAVVIGLLWEAEMRAVQWTGLVAGGAATVAGFILLEGFRRKRFLDFIHGTGFQVSQSVIALASGGFLGVGPGNSIQKFSYLPEAHTDMIFAIVGEEFGLLGVGVVLGLFALFAVAAWHLARRCADPFGRYLIAGFALLVCSQAIINIAGVMGFLPLTGIPLPFMSFGRNNLLVVLTGVGIMLSVARFGPVVPRTPDTGGRGEDADRGDQTVRHTQELANVTYLDRGWGDGGPRGPRSRHS